MKNQPIPERPFEEAIIAQTIAEIIQTTINSIPLIPSEESPRSITGD
jgi:hypothetical protein